MNDWQDDAEDVEDEEASLPCPYCKREIYADAVRCPYCEQYISDEEHPTKKPAWIGITAMVLLLIFIGGIVRLLMISVFN